MNLIEIFKQAEALAAQCQAVDPRQVFELRGNWDALRWGVDAQYAQMIEDRIAQAESYCHQATYEIEFTAREVGLIAAALGFAGTQVHDSIGSQYEALSAEYSDYQPQGDGSIGGQVSAYEVVHLAAGLLLAVVLQAFTADTLAECKALAEQLQALLPAAVAA